ncbi:hypothetical protein O6H91_09G076200 [Diphasiastrum complanatum]|uniref:Uncharacterized protein n=1 Tax=Diphasiastrum complanatum TaxID=34168 RepID=A0ACC2CQT1_DIPCM|nr:hypothetical protein O6H91_09G076200 [Diphasiastrum complanatum]
MASTEAPFATMHNQPKYETRKQADLAPWEKEQWSWRKARSSQSVVPLFLRAQSTSMSADQTAQHLSSAQSAPFGTDQNGLESFQSATNSGSMQKAPWDRDESRQIISKTSMNKAPWDRDESHQFAKNTRWKT